jgi:hypothetical protein
MQQRQLRLGDILDDYCPRERRVTNHAIVAMVGDQIRQTRCTTCDAEHPYKAAKVPPRRKKAVAGEVELPKSDLAQPETTPQAWAAAPSNGDGQQPPADGDTASGSDEQSSAAPSDGPVHRPLIRATLPRTDNPLAARPVPEFTIRQAGRPGKFQRAPGARFPKGRPPVGDGKGRVGGGARGQSFSGRSGHHPHNSGMRSGPHPPRHGGPGGFRPRKKRPK